MNEQQPYERRLAEKFQQLPLPDVDPNWQQMKTLLDKEMPLRGGYWRWFKGIGVLLLMLGGAWIFITQTDADGLAGNKARQPTDNTEHSSTQAPVAAQQDNDARKENTPTPQESTDSPKQSTETKTVSDIEENLHSKSDNKSTNKSDNKPANKVVADEKAREEEINNRRLSVSGSVPKVTRKSRIEYNTVPPVSKIQKPIVDDNAPSRVQEGVAENRLLRTQSTTPENDETIKQAYVRPVSGSVVDPEVQLAGDSIQTNYSRLFPEEQMSPKNTAKKAAKMSALASVENRKIAVGFSLPMGFPLGDQKPGAYNINARPNTISDFIPVPHMQYHINNKVYLQTEVQLMNPQFIQPVLLFQTKTEFPNTNTIHYNSVYARKLYYFNIPVGIHYSPFAHFYLGTGLQFSSLLSGVALREETSFVIGSGTNNILGQQYSKFRNDSVSNRIDNSEFRLMLDANYYWKQFTVGLRYNQALSNYVSFRLNNVSLLFTDKNKSLQFYLRYNLWEDYRRRKK